MPLGGRKNNFLTTPPSQLSNKAVTPNHSSINRPQYRSGTESMSNSLEKNIYHVKNFYGNYQNHEQPKQNSEQRIISSPNNRMIVNNFNSQKQQRGLYPSPFLQSPS